jgi:hypothetical protein
LNPSYPLEECGKRLALEAYHFKERVKDFWNSVEEIVLEPDAYERFSAEMRRILRAYEKDNSRLLRYRNFVVHGRTGRVDEFQYLKSLALCATLIHDDLWAEYRSEFEILRSEWIEVSSNLLRSINRCLLHIEVLNDTLMENRAFSFVNSSVTSSGMIERPHAHLAEGLDGLVIGNAPFQEPD